MPMPPQGKSILQTEDPYHIPGYGGFCPQFKYQIGDTFGQTTSSLLKDPNVSSSGKYVLAEMYARDGGPSQDEILNGTRHTLVKTRTQSWGDQKLVEKMVPGYTGFIPKSQHYFGKRYAENCTSAIADFECDRKQYGKLCQSACGIPSTSNIPKLPALKPKAKDAKTYISPNAHHHSMSPYFMSNDNLEKSFMSGYTGFVPRSRGLIGKGYPIVTHFALNEFTDDVMRHKALTGTAVQLDKPEIIRLDASKIYPVKSGLVPHYTGHIPGQKFRYGATFGTSTKNSLGLSRSQTVA